MTKLLLASTIAASAFVSSFAQAATFNVLLESPSIDGGGTIVIDDTLIASDARVNYLDPLVQISIEFDGSIYDTGFDDNPTGGDTVFIFDDLGAQIIGVDDQTPIGSRFSDFRTSANSNFVLAIDDGPLPGTFVFFDLSLSTDPLVTGNVEITRVSEVPLPYSLPLLGAAFLGLGWLRRKT